MKHSLTAGLVFVSFAVASSCQAATPGKDLRSKIDQYMRAAVKVQHFMGSILVARDGHVVVAKGYGMANAERKIPNTPDTEFRIGSNTKQFTSMAIMLLQADGKLDVHDPVCKYVPDCPKDWQPITIRNLLTHTSGIPDYLAFLNPGTIKEHLAPTRLLALFKDKPLEFKPGARFEYSNSGYVVLGYIIEKVSGESYARFLQQHIFKPLGMQDSGYDISHPTAENHARGYSGYKAGRYTPASFIDMSVPFSAGALYSTVRDLYTWDRALASVKLLPEALHQQMLAPQALVGGSGSSKEFYGYGWVVATEFGRRMYWHSGGIAGYTSLNSWFPKQHVYVIVLDNMSSPHLFEMAKSLTAMLFGKPYTIPKVLKAVHLPATELQRFVGTYQLDPKISVTLTRKGDHLITQMTGQPPVPIFPESKTEFFSKVVSAIITFKLDNNGKVVGFVLHQGGTDQLAKKIK